MATQTLTSQKYYFRFRLYHRLLHGLLMGSFLGLAATGMPLRFNHASWAVGVTQFFGGAGVIDVFHRMFAVLLTLCFLLHLGYIFFVAYPQDKVGVFWGSGSLVPQPKDARDLVQQFRWFFGRGPRPRFGRFTYWEKFDYWAVFWGMAIIGSSGYVMWFSSFFARFLPGWLFNYALLIHADEALLAVWFIFAIHFFNSHLRPEEFPMDMVIFTGRVSEEDLREKRPLEFERQERVRNERGVATTAEADPPAPWMFRLGRTIGFSAIAIGFLLLGLTLLAYLKE